MNEKKIYLRLFLDNYIVGMEDLILKEIVNLLKVELILDSVIEVESIEKYWKIQNLTVLIIRIKINKSITIKNFIDAVDLSWSYNFLQDINKNTIEGSEEAFWDKKTHGGVFINENIVWAQVYNLDE